MRKRDEMRSFSAPVRQSCFPRPALNGGNNLDSVRALLDIAGMKEDIRANFFTGDRARIAFLEATGFERVAAHLGEKILVTHGITSERVISECSAYAMNRSFAFELYVKCLLLLKKRTVPKHHRLLHLFNELPSPLRRQIAKDYRTFMHRTDSGKISGGGSHSLTRVLRDQNTTFVDFRYLYERDAPAAVTTLPICTAIRTTTLRLRPEWAPFATDLET
jgi:hypothetical protein